MSISNTVSKHIERLNKKIDSKLFDLLVDIDDQQQMGYKEPKYNYNLKKAILDKILFDKNIKLNSYTEGVYKYSNGIRFNYTKYELILGKHKDNSIIPLGANTVLNGTPKKYEYGEEIDIVKKYLIDLSVFYKQLDKSFKTKISHVNTINLNKNFAQFNNKISNYNNQIKCGEKLSYNVNKINNKSDAFANMMDNYAVKKYTKNDTLKTYNIDDLTIPKDDKRKIKNGYDSIKNYEFKTINVIESDSDDGDDNKSNKSKDNEMDYSDEETYKNENNIEEEIKFYESKLGIVSNTHKNKDRYKYLTKLANKYSKNYQRDKKFAEYYNMTKSINFNNL